MMVYYADIDPVESCKPTDVVYWFNIFDMRVWMFIRQRWFRTDIDWLSDQVIALELAYINNIRTVMGLVDATADDVRKAYNLRHPKLALEL
jgi:hypothetical protein